MNDSAAVNFFLSDQKEQFAFRRMFHVPRRGEFCTFNNERYSVLEVEWCLDDDATAVGVRVNIELMRVLSRDDDDILVPKGDGDE